MGDGNARLSGITTDREHFHAFLSHNSEDKPLVERLAYELKQRGISCWLDKWNLIPGNPWQPAIEEALGQCLSCVIFFGPHGLSPWHNEEMRLAIQRRVNSRGQKIRVLPVILPGGERAKESDLPGFLQGITWVEFRQSLDDEDALHRLECGIRNIRPGHGPAGAIMPGTCPYLGLKTFQPDDARLFFGRTAKVQELIGGPPQKNRIPRFCPKPPRDLWHDSDVMPAAPVFLQLIADLVVYLGSVRPAEKGYSPLRISFYVGSSHCTKSAKWTRGESIPRRASRWLCSGRFFNWRDALIVVQPQDVDSLASSRVSTSLALEIEIGAPSDSCSNCGA